MGRIAMVIGVVMLGGCTKGDAPGSAGAADDQRAIVTADRVEISLPLRELQMRPGQPMAVLHADRKDGGAAAVVLTFDPEEGAGGGVKPAIVLIDAARHVIGASWTEMHGDATSNSEAMFLDNVQVDNDRLIIRDGGALFDLLRKERPETLSWKPGGEGDGTPQRVLKLDYRK